MIYKDNILYLTLEDMREPIEKALKERLLNSSSKFVGDINKVRFTKKDIGQELARQGYIKKLIQIEGKRSVHYYKPDKIREKRYLD